MRQNRPIPLSEHYFGEVGMQDVERASFEAQGDVDKCVMQIRKLLLANWIDEINTRSGNLMPRLIRRTALEVYAKDWASEVARDALIEELDQWGLDQSKEAYCMGVFSELLGLTMEYSFGTNSLKMIEPAERQKIVITMVIDRACNEAGFDKTLLSEQQLGLLIQATTFFYEQYPHNMARNDYYRILQTHLYPSLLSYEVKKRYPAFVRKIAAQLAYEAGDN